MGGVRFSALSRRVGDKTCPTRLCSPCPSQAVTRVGVVIGPLGITGPGQGGGAVLERRSQFGNDMLTGRHTGDRSQSEREAALYLE